MSSSLNVGHLFVQVLANQANNLIEPFLTPQVAMLNVEFSAQQVCITKFGLIQLYGFCLQDPTTLIHIPTDIPPNFSLHQLEKSSSSFGVQHGVSWVTLCTPLLGASCDLSLAVGAAKRGCGSGSQCFAGQLPHIRPVYFLQTMKSSLISSDLDGEVISASKEQIRIQRLNESSFIEVFPYFHIPTFSIPYVFNQCSHFNIDTM